MPATDFALQWKQTKARLTALTLASFCVALTIVSRAAWIQIKGDSRLQELSRKQFHSRVLLRPRRGLILDRNGEPLAVNLETRSLAANPQKIWDHPTFIRPLAKALGVPLQSLRKKLKENREREFLWIRRHLNEEAFDRFKQSGLITRSGELVEGLWLVKEAERVYPHSELAAQTLGSVNIDGEGVEGVELWKNEKLRGQFASVKAVKDALGRPALIDTTAAQSIKEGEPITLTLDASLQFSVEQELKAAVERTRARSGSVLIMNAENGEILSLASYPTFNPNSREGGPGNRRARAITDGYEPGSTMKPILMAAALSAGMKMTDVVYGNHGSFQVQGRTISEAEAKEKFDWISLKKIITVSSNVGAAKVALKIGADRYTAMLHAFGLGSKTQVGFPGELGGWIPPAHGMKPLTLATMGFGQGLFVTPLQVVRAYSAILNGGFLVQPKLVKPAANEKEVPPKRILSHAVTEKIIDALLSVTEADEGTGHKARVDGYRIAGKTGTSQVVDPRTKRYSASRYIASFTGFAVDVEPKVVVYTQLDGPQNSIYAAETAAPLFSQVMQAVANRFALPMNPKAVLAVKPNAADQMKVSQSAPTHKVISSTSLDRSDDAVDISSIRWEALEIDPAARKGWTMPKLAGLTAREVMRTLEGKDFKVSLKGFGTVRSQSPEAGQPIHAGDRVELRLSE